MPIEWAYIINRRRTNIFKSKVSTVKVTRYEDKYYDAGQFYICPRNKLLKLNFIKKNYSYIGYKLPFRKSIDIDDIED